MPALPKKVRDIHNHHMDSTYWDDFIYGESDIVIGSYCRSGTSWLQQIITQILSNGVEERDIARKLPWIEMRLHLRAESLSAVANMASPRVLKTHLPLDALVFSEKAKYLYIARDGRDVVWSLYNFRINFTDEHLHRLNTCPGRVGPPLAKITESSLSVREYFNEWLEKDGGEWWSYWENIRTWWAYKDTPNILLLHYADLKADLVGQIHRIAAFLGQDNDDKSWSVIAEHSDFGYMKRHADDIVPLRGGFLEGGAKTFMHKGTNGYWRDVLSADEVARYERKAVEELGVECARWLATGKT